MGVVKLFKIERERTLGGEDWPSVYILATSVGTAVETVLSTMPDKDAPMTVKQLAETPMLRVTQEVLLEEIPT